jgi:hypothetical protein
MNFFFLELESELRLRACKAGTLPLVPHLQSILVWLFWKWSLMDCLPCLTSNLDPPDLSVSQVAGITGVTQQHWLLKLHDCPCPEGRF